MSEEEQLIRWLLRRLADANLAVTAIVPNAGNLDVSPDEVIAILRDPEGYWAVRLGMSVDSYHRFREFVAGGPDHCCTHVSETNRKCHVRLDENADVAPWQFVPGMTDRCARHQEFNADGKCLESN
jgi:hypothetical protein